MNSLQILPDQFLFPEDRSFFADSFRSVARFDRTTHTCSESAAHSLFKAEYQVFVLSGRRVRKESWYQVKKPSCLDWYHMLPQIDCLVFMSCQIPSFVICRQCAQTFSMALGEEATAEILQCKQLGSAAVRQVQLSGEGGTWGKVRRGKE